MGSYYPSGFGLTGEDISSKFASTSISSACSMSDWLSPTKPELDSSPISPLADQFDPNNTLSPPSKSQNQEQYGSAETPPGFSTPQNSSLEIDSSFTGAKRTHLQNIENFLLMAPDSDEATTSKYPGHDEGQLRGEEDDDDDDDEVPHMVGSKYRKTAHGVPPPEKHRRGGMIKEADVKQVLMACAEALSNGKMEEFEMLAGRTRTLVSISGEPLQRLGAYMLEGLVARREASGATIYRALRCKEEPEGRELLSYMQILYDICPYLKFGYMAANGAIAEAVRKEDRVHIVDFQIAQGTQWVTLIQALAARPGGPPHVRITGVDDPVSRYARGDDGLEVVGERLGALSRRCRIPLEFRGVPAPGPEVTREMLGVRQGEAVVVNFTLQLHHTPDESVDVNNPRDGLLRMVKSLSPRVMTLVEQESNTNTTPFLTRFAEALDYYSALFESIDATLPRGSRERINVEQHCLAKDVVNIVACEGRERVERHELLGKWRSRLTMAGFRPYPLSTYINSVIRALLTSYSDKYTLLEKDGAMLLGWKNRNLISASAWH